MAEFARIDDDRMIPKTWQERGGSAALEAAKAAEKQAMDDMLVSPEGKLKEARRALMQARGRVNTLEKAEARARAGRLEAEDIDQEDLSLAEHQVVRARDRSKPSFLACTGCGEAVEKNEDGELPEKHLTARRVVRPGNTYGGSGAGSEVVVEVRHLTGAALEATMSPAEYRAAEERARRPRQRPVGKLQQMVMASQAAVEQQSKELIARGKRALKRDAERVTQEADDKVASSVDREPESQKRRPVSG